MNPRRSNSSAVLLGLGAVALLGWTASDPDAAAAPAPFEDVYPVDITPPAGTRYPCALTALPRDLPGIPEGDRTYINRTYTRVLRATQAKLVLLKALEDGRDIQTAHERYAEAVAAIAERQGVESVPAGLAPFHEHLQEAVRLQQAFFVKAVALRAAGGAMADAYRIPEGRQASSRLISAWGRMQARYPTWSPETKDSIYHHLCALDLF